MLYNILLISPSLLFLFFHKEQTTLVPQDDSPLGSSHASYQENDLGRVLLLLLLLPEASHACHRAFLDAAQASEQ